MKNQKYYLRNKIFKTLLATSFSLALIPCSFAANQPSSLLRLVKTDSKLSTGTEGGNITTPFESGSILQYDGLGNWTVVADISNVSITSIDINSAINSNLPGIFTIQGNTIIGDIINSGNNPNARLSIIAANSETTFTGTGSLDMLATGDIGMVSARGNANLNIKTAVLNNNKFNVTDNAKLVFEDDVMAMTMNISKSASVTFKNNLNINSMYIRNNGLVNFETGINNTKAGPIIIGDSGTVHLGGNVNIVNICGISVSDEDRLHSNGTIRFTNKNPITYSGSIGTADNVDQGAGMARPIKAIELTDANVTIQGMVIGNDTTLSLSNQELQLKGRLLMQGATVIQTTFDGTKGGHLIVQQDDSIVDFSQSSSISIVVNDGAVNDNKAYSYTLLQSTGGGRIVPGSTVLVTSNNRYIKWGYNPETYVLSRAAGLTPTIPDDTNASGGDDHHAAVGKVLSDPNATGAAKQVQINFGTMATEDVLEAVSRLQPTEIVETSLEGTQITVENRISDLFETDAQELDTPAPTEGVSSGCEGLYTTKHGLWITPFGGKSNQKAHKQDPSYKTTSYGLSVGYDTKINDDWSVGLALTSVKTNVKHKEAKDSDKGKTNTFILSLYALNQMNEKWFSQGMISVGHSRIESSEKRIIDSNTEQNANGKYKAKSYSGEIMLGYSAAPAKSISLAPMLGLRYTKFPASSYKETGASIQNLSIKNKGTDIFEGILGARLLTKIAKNGMLFIPEIHGFLNYSFKDRTPKIEARLEGLPSLIPVRVAKSDKAWYNVGTSLSVEHNNMEYGIKYDSVIAKKYLAHQGALKIKVNF